MRGFMLDEAVTEGHTPHHFFSSNILLKNENSNSYK